MKTNIKNDQMKFGKNLKEIREKRGMTQVDIAIKAGITINYYARIERGEENPSLEVLRGLATALKVKSREFLPF